jgi:S-formylglutathione hydrolase FrmB
MKAWMYSRIGCAIGITLFMLLGSVNRSIAAKVDTVETYSAAMKKNIKAVVILPEGYSSSKTYPTIYILHGHGGNYASWIKGMPALGSYADQQNLILVCPDGNVSSWYLDSPVDPAWRYETYVGTELVKYIDDHYKTIKDRKGRAITGLSMGGHGALYLAFRHQDVFGAAGSMSGGVDIKPFPLNWSLAKRLGAYAQYPDNWVKNSVIDLTHLLTTNNLALIIDCGKEDFFYNVNVALHEKLMYSNIPHDFIIRPGAHNWDYWKNAVGYQLLYFKNFFDKK